MKMFQIIDNWQNHSHKFCSLRLARTVAILKTTFIIGFLIGGYRGGKRASLQFLAENQHTMPGIKTRREAAAFFRLRTSKIIIGAGKEGVRRGIQLVLIAGLFESSRWAVSIAHRHGYWPWQEVEEVIAGLAVGSIFVFTNNKRRARYLGRGLVMGGGLGACLSTMRYAINYTKDSFPIENKD